MNSQQELRQKPLWQMTGEEFLQLQKMDGTGTMAASPSVTPLSSHTSNSSLASRKYVYGIAQLFGCSIPTANRIKKSGRIKEAITQIGRKIIVDTELALQLVRQKKKL